MCKAVGKYLPVIKVFPADKAGSITPAHYDVSAFMLDTPSQDHGGTGRIFDWNLAVEFKKRITKTAHSLRRPEPRKCCEGDRNGATLCGRREQRRGGFPGPKRPRQAARFYPDMQKLLTQVPDATGHFGPYGGMFVPETLMAPLHELAAEYEKAQGRSRRSATS